MAKLAFPYSLRHVKPENLARALEENFRVLVAYASEITVEALGGYDTDDLAEGSTNLYYTNARVDTQVGTLDLTDLSDADYDDLSNVPTRASVWLDTGQELTSGSAEAVSWTDEEVDEDGYWAAGNPTRFTIPATGTYRFVGSGEFINTDTDGLRILYVRLNGTTDIGRTQIQAATDGVTVLQVVTKPVSLTASDYVELMAYQNSGTDQDISAGQYRTWFTVEEVK